MTFYEHEKPTDSQCRGQAHTDGRDWHQGQRTDGAVKPEGFMEACLLLLLSEQESYGYELIPRLEAFGFGDNQDPGMVYRYLRRLEKRGMIESQWDTSGTGAARRVYAMTPDGYDLLSVWAETIRLNIGILSRFMDRYQKIDYGS